MIREYIYFIDDNPNGTNGITKEEIIRCMDCEFYKKDGCLGSCDIHDLTIVGTDDFCSYGVRKEQNNERTDS